MIRRLMIVTLIGLLAYIFYAEFMADSMDPFFKKITTKNVLSQKIIPKTLANEFENQ